MPTVYLDYNATTPVDTRVLAAMLPWLTHQFGNAASRDHAFGWDAAEAVEEARDHVSRLVNANSKGLPLKALILRSRDSPVHNKPLRKPLLLLPRSTRPCSKRPSS